MQDLATSDIPLAARVASHTASAVAAVTTTPPGSGSGSIPASDSTTTATATAVAVSEDNEEEYTSFAMLTQPMLPPSPSPSPSASASASAPPSQLEPQIQPKRLSRLCFGSEKVPHPRNYHAHPSSPNFLICEFCFNRAIAPYPSLAGIFTRIPMRENGACSFNALRVTKVLWPAVVHAHIHVPVPVHVHDVQGAGADADVSQGQGQGEETAMAALVAYMRRRSEVVKDCKGEAGALTADGMKWYIPAGDAIPHMVVCEACYEEVVLATAPGFANRFTEHHTPQGVSSGKWVCDLGRQMIYMRRITWSRGRKGDWDGFVAEAKRRMAMPACEGKIKTAGQNVWFRPKGVTVDEFRFCETCYTDAFADSKWEDVFEKVVETSKTEWTMHKCAWKWNLPVTQFTFAVQTTKQPADDLRLGLAVIAGKPRCCTREGIKGGRFYNLRNAVSEFGVCEACYEGFVRAVGMASFFSDTPVTIPQAAYCVFNTFLDRWGQFIERYNEALDTGRFSAYEDAVRN